MQARRLTADWVLPMSASPIRNGAVLLDEQGRIAVVGPDDNVPCPPGVPSHRFAAATLLPGLVNAHTHLELTGLRATNEHADFPSWIGMVRALKAGRSSAEFVHAARTGIREGWSSGITTVADTGDTGATAEALAELGGRGVAYHEVFGPDPVQCADSMQGLKDAMAGLARFASDAVRLGVSPHAPYSVSAQLYAAAARWAREQGFPLALHLAESGGESSLLADASGCFAEMWRRRNIPAPVPTGLSPVAFVDRYGVLGPDALCIHAVRVDASDIGILAARGVGIAHCPLSNRAHAHGSAPLGALLRAGLRVGVGTDSVLSVGRIDLLAEARAARQLAGLGAAQALALVTRDAARAIGMGDEVGVLESGRQGDLLVARTAAGEDPVEAVLDSPPGTVLATFVSGRLVFATGHGLPGD